MSAAGAPRTTKQVLSAWLIRWTVSLLHATWRVRLVDGDRLDRRIAERRPAVLSFWHEQVCVLAPLLARRLIRNGYPVTLLSSRSRDGELGAMLGEAWGAEIVRGSASRGGTEGLRGMYRSIRKRGGSPVVIPDGPRGPAYQAKPGAVVLAQMAGVPIQPFGVRVRSAWRLGSWDRMLVPKPFARVDIHVGEAIEIPAELGADRIEAWQRRLADCLDALSGRVDS